MTDDNRLSLGLRAQQRGSKLFLGQDLDVNLWKWCAVCAKAIILKRASPVFSIWPTDNITTWLAEACWLFWLNYHSLSSKLAWRSQNKQRYVQNTFWIKNTFWMKKWKVTRWKFTWVSIVPIPPLAGVFDLLSEI